MSSNIPDGEKNNFSQFKERLDFNEEDFPRFLGAAIKNPAWALRFQRNANEIESVQGQVDNIISSSSDEKYLELMQTISFNTKLQTALYLRAIELINEDAQMVSKYGTLYFWRGGEASEIGDTINQSLIGTFTLNRNDAMNYVYKGASGEARQNPCLIRLGIKETIDAFQNQKIVMLFEHGFRVPLESVDISTVKGASVSGVIVQRL